MTCVHNEKNLLYSTLCYCSSKTFRFRFRPKGANRPWGRGPMVQGPIVLVLLVDTPNGDQKVKQKVPIFSYKIHLSVHFRLRYRIIGVLYPRYVIFRLLFKIWSEEYRFLQRPTCSALHFQQLRLSVSIVKNTNFHWETTCDLSISNTPKTLKLWEMVVYVYI